jgi:hypothetical protein
MGLVGAIGLLAATIMAFKGTSRAALLALFVGLSLWSDAQWFTISRYWKEDSRGAAALLGASLPAGSRVAVAPSYVRKTLAYYSSRIDSKICYVGIEPGEGLPADETARALVLSRLHHLPDWRRLEDAFEQQGSGTIEADSLDGYRVMIRRDPPQANRAPGTGASC